MKNATKKAASDPNAEMETLLEAKRLAVTTGTVQVVIALASVTSVVTVDTTKKPIKVNPPNLRDLSFADVGLDDDGVAIFKENLIVLLDFIADDIRKLPDNRNVNIGKVLEFVRLSILAAG